MVEKNVFWRFFEKRKPWLQNFKNAPEINETNVARAVVYLPMKNWRIISNLLSTFLLFLVLFSRSNHIPDLNYVCNLRQHRPEVVFLLIFEQQKIHQNSGNVFLARNNKVVKLSTFSIVVFCECARREGRNKRFKPLTKPRRKERAKLEFMMRTLITTALVNINMPFS